MKKALVAFALFGALATASAGTTNLYVEDWGTTNGGSSIAYGYSGDAAYPFGQIGWGIVVPAAQTGGGPPYEGIYQSTSPIDANTGQSLPINTVYYTYLSSGQAGMLYTTDASGAGSAGDSSFTDINPELYTGLTLSVEGQNTGTTASNYFAVQVGGAWYISTNLLSATATTGSTFDNASTPYTNAASAWNNLSFTGASITVGSVASANLSGPITGVGLVEFGPGGWDYNELSISASCPTCGGSTVVPASILEAPVSQTTYAGGGVSFAVETGGTQPITYFWETNGVPLTDGGRISGSSTPMLTITNVNANDAAVAYSVIVSNAGNVGATPPATSSGFTLTVNPVPSDVLYAETVPYIGPTGAGTLPTSTIGWGTAAPSGGIYDAGGGQGAVFAYTGETDSIIYYTDTAMETNQSGLAFPTINPADYPYIAFETSLDANSVVTDVTAYFAVQMTSGSATNWYVYGSPIAENLATTGVFESQELQFTTQASRWKNLTINSGSVTIGSQAAGTLAGNITGAGLVFSFNGGGGDFNWDAFEITTDQVQAQPPSITGAGAPWSQSVAAGGAASFEVATVSGATPFTYGWTLNGAPLANGTLPDGAVVSGAQSPIVTIAGVTTNEVGGNGGTVNVVAFVTNSVGYDESDNYIDTALTVTNPSVGLLYSQSFPWINPSTSGNLSIGPDGWAEAFYTTPASLYNLLGGNGAVFVYDGSAATVAYYTTTLETNETGMPFPNINLAGYPALTLSAEIEAGYQAANVTAYWAVQINGSAWYINTNAISASATSFSPYTLAFNAAAANWTNITLTTSGVLLGGPAAGNLSGVMTGAGLVFVVVSPGGDYNFDNFTITGSGLGGLNVGPLTNGIINLSWVGNPAVNLQSTTNLSSPASWQDVPNTLGLFSLPVPVSGPQKFYRLIEH